MMSKRVPRPDNETVEELIVEASINKGYSVCGYWKRTGGVCLRRKSRGRHRCATPNHGGKAARGTDHPGFIHGRRSKDFPVRLVGNYERAINDRFLYSLRPDVALVVANLDDRVNNLSTASSAEIVERMFSGIDTLQKALRKGEEAGVTIAMNHLFAIRKEMGTEAQNWREIFELQIHKKKLIEQERKNARDLQKVYTEERLMLLIGVIFQLVEPHLKNPEEDRIVISRGLGKALAEEPGTDLFTR